MARPFDAAQGQVAPLATLRQARLTEAHSMLLVHALQQNASDEEE